MIGTLLGELFFYGLPKPGSLTVEQFGVKKSSYSPVLALDNSELETGSYVSQDRTQAEQMLFPISERCLSAR